MHKTMLVGLFTLMFTLAYGQNRHWQQRAEYKMSIEMDVKNNTYRGQQKLKYFNNSPDTIEQVFYHLYYNAFQPGSMMDVRSRTISDPDSRVGERISHLTESELGNYSIISLKSDDKTLSYTIEHTLLKVILSEPLLPGKDIEFNLEYIAQIPVQIRRTGRDNKEGIRYSMSQWYPKLAEYDEMGWHADPYIAREFHGVWGDFDVEIFIDSDYVIGSTGVLQNTDEIGYNYSEKRKKPKSKKGKTRYHFKAKSVHDFAWAADPDYTHDFLVMTDGPTLRAFYQEGEKTQAWDSLLPIMQEAVRYASKNFGNYPYKNYNFVQGGDGGMEYPHLTLITGHRPLPSLVGVSVHEFMHSWFQGLLATNEALHPWMDEGFTTYASARIMNHLRCNGFLSGDCKDYLWEGDYSTVIGFHAAGRDEPLCSHSDHYTTNAAYSVASYVKGKVFLVQLEYIIGKEAFDRGMLRYYDEWSYRHPDPMDFLRIMEKESGIELDWYYQYFIQHTDLPDYGISVLKDGTNKDTIELARIGRMPMPIDLQVKYTDGSISRFHLPLVMMHGNKVDKKSDVVVSKPWPWTHPTYKLAIDNKESEIYSIEIDPSNRLVDKDRSNNYWPRAEKSEED